MDARIGDLVVPPGSLYCRLDYNVCDTRSGSVISTELSGHHSASHKPKTILIAGDNEMVRTKIRQAIERDTDFEVCGESTDGTDAVSMAKALSPDLIILDLRMPGLNGVEVAGIRSNRAMTKPSRVPVRQVFIDQLEECEAEWRRRHPLKSEGSQKTGSAR